MTNKVRYLGDVDSGPSPRIFGDLAKLRADADLGKCAFFDEDFLLPPVAASNTWSTPVYTYITSGATIQGKAVNDTDVELGVLEFGTLDGDNEEAYAQFGYGNQWRLDNTAGNTSKVGYEVRYRVDSIAADQVATAVGLVEGPVADSLLDDNTGEIKDSVSFIGFRSLNTDPGNLDIVYQDTGATDVQTVLVNAAVLVADTYKKLGFLFDPYELDSTKKMTFFVDGVPVAYLNTAQIDASTFPEAEGMVPVFLTKTFSTGANAVDLDRATGFIYRNAIEG